MQDFPLVLLFVVSFHGAIIIYFIWSHIDFLYLELPDSVETAPINEKHYVLDPYRNDGDVANWDFSKAERPHDTKTCWFIARLAEQTKPLNDFST